jgi:hypothetical protein
VSRSRWYRGLKLYLITTPDGMTVAGCLADPKTGEREAASELLAQAARATEGLYARLAQRLEAVATSIWHNWASSEPVKRSLTAYDNCPSGPTRRRGEGDVRNEQPAATSLMKAPRRGRNAA